MKNEWWRMGAVDMAEGIRNGLYSSLELVESCIDRLKETRDLNAFTEVRIEAALSAAHAADADVSAGKKLGVLHGVPVSIKSNVDLTGWVTDNGSKTLKDNMARETSPSVQNWLNEGAVVLGRTNCPEFCCRWETTNELHGATKNPWNDEITPGGSSGGAASSLAAGVTPLALGNDLGGSLRQPAQACGIASHRPTHGRVPNYRPSDPEPPIGNQLCNTDGPMARSIADVRLGLVAMAKYDWRDPWCLPLRLNSPAKNDLPVAVITNPMDEGIDEQVADGVEKAIIALAKAGYPTEIDEPAGLADAYEVWRDVVLGGIFMGLQPAVKDVCGAALVKVMENYRETMPEWAAGDYVDGLNRRLGVFRDWLEFFQQYSVIVAPVSTLPPQVTDYDLTTPENAANLIHSMRMVVAINALGLPSTVVPVGVKDGLPQVVQVIGAPFEDMRCLEVAEAIENQLGGLTPIDPR